MLIRVHRLTRLLFNWKDPANGFHLDRRGHIRSHPASILKTTFGIELQDLLKDLLFGTVSRNTPKANVVVSTKPIALVTIATAV